MAFARWERVCLLMLGLLLAGLLLTAGWLRPDPAGYGTHRQLGLGACTMSQLLGGPCPTCGMTTAWAWLVRGEPTKAAAANLGGVATCVAAMLVCPWALASAAVGRWWPARPNEAVVIGVAVGLVFITLVDWTGRLMDLFAN